MNKELIWWHLRKIVSYILFFGVQLSVGIAVFPDVFVNSRYTFTVACFMSVPGACLGTLFYHKSDTDRFIISRGYTRDELWFIKLLSYLMSYVIFMLPQIFVTALIFTFEINFVELSYMQINLWDYLSRLTYLSTGFWVVGVLILFIHETLKWKTALKFSALLTSSLALFLSNQDSLIFDLLGMRKIELVTLYLFLLTVTVFIRKRQWRYMEVVK